MFYFDLPAGTFFASTLRLCALAVFFISAAVHGEPIAPPVLLRASNAWQLAQFGHSVAVSGDTMVIGAPGEESNTTGVNTPPSGYARDSGAVYVFVRTGGLWIQQAHIKASNTGSGDRFGTSVAITGDTLVVGAIYEDSATTGVNSVPNESADGAGAAYVFVRQGGVWAQQAYLKASNAGSGDEFGHSVAVSGDTLIVGAGREDSTTTGVDSIPNESASSSGAAYVFVRNGGVWAQQAYLKASNTGSGDFFGESVSISDNTIVVGAAWEDSSGTGMNPASNETASASGAAYVFVRSGGVWAQQAFLKSSNTASGNFFGCSVCIFGETAVVGSYSEDSSTTGVNSTPDTIGYGSGAAYVFTRQSGTWTQQAYLKASNTGQQDGFGWSVALSGDSLVVGANQEDSSTTGVNSFSNEGASSSGAAYVFTRTAGTWAQRAYLKASNTGVGDWFGAATAVSGDTVLVGAYQEDGNFQFNSDSAGAAYVFTDLTPPFTTGMSANGLVGQADFDDRVLTPGQNVVGRAASVAISVTGKLAVADQSSHRVLLWNSLPNSSSQPANVVVGQPDFATFSSGLSASKLNLPGEVIFSPDGTKLLVADTANNRVLIWNTVPTANGVSADLVIGQADFTSAVFATSSSGLKVPMGMAFSPGGKLLISDNVNNRVLVYNSLPTTSNAAADVVIGQANFTTMTSGTGSTEMDSPCQVAVAWDGRLIVSDRDNRRVLIYNSIPTVSGAAANTVIGQTAFGTRASFGQSATAMDSPWGVAVSPIGQLAVTDLFNHRVLVYDTLPTSHGASADYVLGQPDFTSDAPDNGGIHAASMNEPADVTFSSDGRLWVAGTEMRRVMIFGDAPEIAVSGNGMNIVKGDVTPTADDHTDFGDTLAVNGSTVRTFTLQNSGTSALHPGQVTLSGAHAADFSVTVQPELAVLPGASTTFQITFRPSLRSLRTAALSFASNDADENPFSFSIQGTGIGPEIAVSANGLDIVRGDQTPRPEDNTHFGSVPVAGGSVTHTFTIQNAGNTDLTLSNVGFYSHSNHFAITRAPVSPVPAGGSTTFDVTFAPSVVSFHSVTVRIDNDDPDENPFHFNLHAYGSGPEISVQVSSTTIVNGDSTPSFDERTDFGSIPTSYPFARSFGITNQGDQPLTLDAITISGVNAGDFSLTRLPVTPVGSSSSTFFEITFTPSALGTRSATVSFGNNDHDENPFSFSIQGTGTNLAPTNISLNNSSVAEGNFPGTAVGYLAATDPDPGQTHTFSLVAGTGDEDNAAFLISGSLLIANVTTDFETKSSYNLRLRTTDSSNFPLAYEKAFTVTVMKINETALAIAQQAFFKASNTGTTDLFGRRVAVSGDTVVVGAAGEDSSGTGVNSIPNEDAANAGAAYVFVRGAGGWTQQAFLKASNTGAGDAFGFSVAISGDTIVVGTPNESSSTTGVNSSSNEDAVAAGAVYVFNRHEGEWTQQAYLKASSTGAYDYFGHSVAISGDTLIVGAGGEDSSSSGVNSNPNENATDSGAAYIFTRSAGAWSQEAYVKTSQPGAGDGAGYSVAISGETAVIGATGEDSSTTGVNTSPNNSASGAGAVYVFQKTAGTWSQNAYLKSSNSEAGDGFGYSVAISGNTLIAGATGEDSDSTGVNSLANNNTVNSGAAYVFTRKAGSWSQQAYLKASNTGLNDYFGEMVAVSGDIAVVGTTQEDSGLTGVNHPYMSSPYNDGSDQAGAAYVFLRTGTTWAQNAYVKAHNTGAGDYFGGGASVSGDLILLGGGMEDSSTTGINSPFDELAANAGAVYAYALPPSVEVAVSGNAENIADGDTTPSLNDHTHFGNVSDAFGSMTRTFMVQNMGTTPLTLGNARLSGANAQDFTLALLPAATVVGGDVTLIKVTFNPGALGPRNAMLTFDTNDTDESSFNFHLQGVGVEAEIAVTGNSGGVTNGDASPSLANGTDFGKVVASSGGIEHTFMIRNTGTADLVLGSVAITGTHAPYFTITQAPATTVLPGSGTSFKIRINPGAGMHHAIVSFTTNDPNEESYSFAIWGMGAWTTPSTQTVTFNPPATLYLNQGPVTLSANASSGLPVTLARVSGPATLSGNVLTLTGVGTVKINATQIGNGSFKAAPTITKTIVVKASPTTPALVDLSQTYNSLPRPVRVLGASGVPVITYTIGTVVTISAPVHAGRYPVKATVDGKTLTGSLVVAQANLRVTADSHRRFIGQANPPLAISYSGFVGTDTESSAFALAGAKRPVAKTTANATSPGGLYPITASGAVLRNYQAIYGSGQMFVETFAGLYEALLVDTNGLPAAKVAFTVAASSTTLSGKLTVPGETAPLAFTGTLSVNAANEKATGASKPLVKGDKTYVVSFDLPFGTDFESELRINNTLTAQMTEGKKIFMPAAGAPVYHTGAHTLILAPALPANPDVPSGSGHATATIDAKTTLTIAGRLADGTTLTASLLPDAQAGYRLFAQPYTRVGSYIAGWLDFVDHPHRGNRMYVPASAGCDLVWAKVGRNTDKSYRDNFGPVLTRVTVDPWIVPGKTETLAQLLGLPAGGTFDVTHSGLVSASSNNLPVEAGLGAANKIVITAPVTQPANTTKWTATITPATGAFAGSFELVDAGKNRTVPFTGILRQPHGTGGALGAGQLLVPAQPSDPTNEITSGNLRFDP